MPETERMRGCLTPGRIEEQWTSRRSRAIEPLIRESPARVLPDGLLPAAAIGCYRTCGNDVEIGLVGADRQPVARQLFFPGSAKWLANSAFDSHDLAVLQKHRAAITDEPVPLVAVPRRESAATAFRRCTAPRNCSALGSARERELKPWWRVWAHPLSFSAVHRLLPAPLRRGSGYL